jgi:hypothetical protein
MATYKKPRTKMGSVTGTVPTVRGAITPGGTRDTLQQMAVRRSNRKASPATAIERAGLLSPSTYLTQPTLLQSLKKKEATKKKKKSAKKKKKKQSEVDQLIERIKKYGIKN